MSFEQQFGSLEEIEHALSATKDFKRREDARRQKAWEAQTYAQAAISRAQATAIIPVEPSSNGVTSATQSNDTMDVDPTHATINDRPLKRKRSENEIVVDAHSPKKPRAEGQGPEIIAPASNSPNSQVNAEASLKR